MVIGLNLGSITSRCVGNEPALLPRKDCLYLSREGQKSGSKRAVETESRLRGVQIGL